MVVKVTLDQHGLKKVRNLLSVSRWERGRRKGLTEGVNVLREMIVADSRELTGKYKGAWRVNRSKKDEKVVYNDARDKYGPYPQYVTGADMRSVWAPRGGAGDAFMRHVKRKFRPRARRIMITTMRKYIETGR